MRSATLAAFLFVAATLNAQKIKTFDVPNARDTTPTAISSSGEIVGSYLDAKSTVSRGFLRDHNGKISTFDDPNGTGTHPTAVNAGQIVGYYDAAKNPYPEPSQPGFIRSANGAFTKFSTGFTYAMYPSAINTSGEIVGHFIDLTGLAGGFVRSSDGSISGFFLGVPTIITALNSTGEYTGFRDVHGRGDYDGFLQQPNEATTFFAVPNATVTYPEAINDKGQIAGSYTIVINSVGHTLGFVRYVDGSFTTFDVPGATGIGIVGIDSSGAVAGYYQDVNGRVHGFVYADGNTTTIDAPGSTHTNVVAINPKGEIVGSFLDAKGAIHGFVLKARHDDGDDDRDHGND
jgi:uncharacterized membrane protein